MSKASDSGHSHAHSFTDLMTSLAVIFILLLVASLNNAFSESDDAVQDLRKQVASMLEKELGLLLTPDPTDPFTQIINLDEEKVKFEYKDHALKAEGADLVGKLFLLLSPKLCDKFLYEKIESIIIEGHTSTDGKQYLVGLGELKLSQDRAYSVLERAYTVLAKSQRLGELKCLRALATATGRGFSKPKETDAASRRVEIKIRVKTGLSIPTSGIKKEGT